MTSFYFQTRVLQEDNLESRNLEAQIIIKVIKPSQAEITSLVQQPSNDIIPVEHPPDGDVSNEQRTNDNYTTSHSTNGSSAITIHSTNDNSAITIHSTNDNSAITIHPTSDSSDATFHPTNAIYLTREQSQDNNATKQQVNDNVTISNTSHYVIPTREPITASETSKSASIYSNDVDYRPNVKTNIENVENDGIQPDQTANDVNQNISQASIWLPTNNQSQEEWERYYNYLILLFQLA